IWVSPRDSGQCPAMLSRMDTDRKLHSRRVALHPRLPPDDLSTALMMMMNATTEIMAGSTSQAPHHWGPVVMPRVVVIPAWTLTVDHRARAASTGIRTTREICRALDGRRALISTDWRILEVT